MIFIEDICYIISDFLFYSKDIISFFNVNKLTRRCKFNITLDSYCNNYNNFSNFNITKILSTFNNFNSITINNSLQHLALSYKYSNELNILEKIPNLINLHTLALSNIKLTDKILEKLVNLTSLNIGYINCNNFTGECLQKFTKLKTLKLGYTFIDSKYIQNLTKLEKLYINTQFNINNFHKLTNLHVLDVSVSEYVITDETILSLTNLRVLKCKYSTISKIDHLLNLKVLILGLNYVMKKIYNNKLHTLSISSSKVRYIYVPNIIKLVLNECISDNLLKKCTTLQDLHFGNNTIITDDGIQSLVNLTTLHCNFNRNITNKGIADLKKIIKIHCGFNYLNVDHLSNLHCLEHYEYNDSINLESVKLLINRTI